MEFTETRAEMTHLGYAGGAVPVSLWDTGDLGFVTVGVAAFVAAVTQQQQVLVVALLAHLTVLAETGGASVSMPSRVPLSFFAINRSPLS